MTPILPHLVFLLLLTSLYAMALSTPVGREFTRSKTWVTVVVGVALVLGAFALFWFEAALYAFIFFAVGGAPILVKEIIDEFRRERAAMRRSMGD